MWYVKDITRINTNALSALGHVLSPRPCYWRYIYECMSFPKYLPMLLFLTGCVSTPDIEIREDSKLSGLSGINICNFNYQCKKLYTGFNPCGGHTGYITYSTQIGKENIDNLKKSVIKDRKDEEERYFAFTDGSYECQPSITLWPNPICSKNKCLIK